MLPYRRDNQSDREQQTLLKSLSSYMYYEGENAFLGTIHGKLFPGRYWQPIPTVSGVVSHTGCLTGVFFVPKSEDFR